MVEPMNNPYPAKQECWCPIKQDRGKYINTNLYYKFAGVPMIDNEFKKL